ncbi:unnamed protein product [Eruca vesicaria subsp. sativa]|uniref:Uncharacterized protein n=1 Tax=Eruca vesicaria subsp. sativa TaxID=29727 RepID=A0ABC8L926_ERUVS|nr:unnamed protein product [Eruca vesicaria subsp. sativa]
MVTTHLKYQPNGTDGFIFITDHTGDELLSQKPESYAIGHRENFSGEGDAYIYHSKRHTLNPGQKIWTRYQPWVPTKTK